MARTSQRRTWTVAGVLVGVGLVAWLASMGTSRVARHYLALPDGAELTVLGEPSMADAGSTDAGSTANGAVSAATDAQGAAPFASRSSIGTKQSYVNPILDRNIFDSANVGMKSSGGPVVPGGDYSKSDLKVVLLATVVAEPVEYSSALLAEEKGKTGAVGYGIGDEVLGEATIIGIEPRRVIVRRSDGSEEYIAMEEGRSFKKETTDSGAAKGEEDAESGVTKAGDNKFIVDQALVDSMLENPEKLYSKVRAVPHKGSDGEVDGYRLSGIRRKSVFSQLGVKNGDIVHGVNGKSLNSMSGAMDAFNSLQSEKNFTFELTRRGQRQTFEYEIR